MDEKLQTFLQGMTPLVEERQDWQGAEVEFLQTRATYLLSESDAPPSSLVTSVRAILTRGPQVMVVRDPESEHILPGGRVLQGEELLETLKREMLEETGWSIRAHPRLIGMFHFHVHSPKPAGHLYPYPDFLQIIYSAEADKHFPDEIEIGGYELGAEFRPRKEVERLPLSMGEAALLLHTQ